MTRTSYLSTLVAALFALTAMFGQADAHAGTYTWIICGNSNPYSSASQGDHVTTSAVEGAFVMPCHHNNNNADSATRKNDYTTFTAISAPGGSTITSVALDATGNNYAFNRGWGYLVYSNEASFRCSFYENEIAGASCGDGASGFSTHGPKTLAQSALGATAAYVGIYCRNLNGCLTGTLDLFAQYLSVQIRDDVRPTLKLSGAAWAETVLTGTPTLSYAAADNASGTSGIRVSFDGKAQMDTVAADSVGCDDGQWHHCPDDSGTVALPLGGVSDGEHTMSVYTEDAVGNLSIDQSRQIVVDNIAPSVGAVKVSGTAREGSALACSAPVDGQSPKVTYQWSRALSDGSGEQAIAGATEASYGLTAGDVGRKVLCEVTGTDGGGSAKRKSGIADGPFGEGALVATGPSAGGGGPTKTDTEVKVPGGAVATSAQSVASAAAAAAAAVAPCVTGKVKSFGTVTKLTRSYNRSAVSLNGRLLGVAGEARPKRTLEVVQTVVRAGTATRVKIASVTTGTDGSFRVSAPPGPSRALQVVDPDCGSVGPVLTERVRGALQATTTTRRVRNRQTARFTGRALGGYVGRGIPLELQVKVGRQWRDVKHATTNSRGEYKVGYRFLRTYVRYTYRFRMVSRAGGAWPYMPATSKIVKVRVN